jgi:hypothetical protein
VIRKGKTGKPHRVRQARQAPVAENQIVIDYEVYARRPNDVNRLIPALHAARAVAQLGTGGTGQLRPRLAPAQPSDSLWPATSSAVPMIATSLCR